ncbi:hypothetical protein [Paenimyroides aestuarii]|uniref:LAGLIDADG homing endonuclease n=1 Tax=Paenimyroides aestuarii TaxID=2968490 RepID=A0ABY5NPM9_9FLAO|nr:hypothetical protein [Paenimyroides aestuarii]UUV20384.1 hypothetical protein NPX36_08385 [Paenimyroides aestuarii]
MLSAIKSIYVDREIKKDLSSSQIFNLGIVSVNLEDFNKRFQSNIVLEFDSFTNTFSCLSDENDLGAWFCDGIGELLAFANNPNHQTKDIIDQYINSRKTEVDHLRISSLFESYRKRYIHYTPIGFLNDANEMYIKNQMDVLLDIKVVA